MKREYRPPGSPYQQIPLALDAVNVGKEARHQSGGDEQRQGNETLMHQEYIRFYVHITDDFTQVTKAQKPIVPCSVPATLARAREDRRRATEQGRARAPSKYSIMDYGIFRKQVYRRTGGQRDSVLKVTDSIQREPLYRAGLLHQVLAQVLRITLLTASDETRPEWPG